MSDEDPKEPPCPAGRVPHRKRVRKIDQLLREGQVGGIVVDDTPEHRAWYLHEIKKYPRLAVDYEGVLAEGMYLIRVRKGPSVN